MPRSPTPSSKLLLLVQLLLLQLAPTLLGCEASSREVFVTRAIPSADGTWLWLGQIDVLDTPGAVADAGVDGAAGADAGPSSTPAIGRDAWIARLTGERVERWQLGVGREGTLETVESFIELRDTRIAAVGSIEGATDTDAWLLFLEARGAVSAQKALGGPGDQRFVEVLQLDNNDIVALGLGTSEDGSGDLGILAVRFSTDGEITWQRQMVFPGTTRVRAVHLMERPDGRLILLGAIDRTEAMRGLDIWAASIDLAGNLEWQRTLGTTADDQPAHAVLTDDGGIVIASRVVPLEPPSDPNARVTGDIWVVKADPGGSVVWQRYFEKQGFDEVPVRVLEKSDGSFGIVGTADGFGSRSAGDYDVWLLSLAADGAVEGQYVIGSLEVDRPVGIDEVDRQRFTVTGVIGGRPAYWTVREGDAFTGEGALEEGCGLVSGTDALLIDTATQTFEGLGRWDTPTLALSDSTASTERPPPLQPLECRTAP